MFLLNETMSEKILQGGQTLQFGVKIQHFEWQA
jgi:hypothetical protein